MAIDTANKRIATCNFGSGLGALGPEPDGTINDEDRVLIAYSYSGISILPPVVGGDENKFGGAQPHRVRRRNNG